MIRVNVSANGRSFMREDAPWLYVADTAWSAFTNATRAQWRAYLDLRRSQGFSAIQINILPQWDRPGGAFLHGTVLSGTCGRCARSRLRRPSA